MSTLSSQISKGEKTKSKFQSLDINNLYRVSRGENLEKQQQKSSSTFIKHGMQSLGKVPSARRAPANLPSLKSEHSGADAAVPLVPPGASGWGKQDSTASNSSATPPSTTTTPTVAPPPSTITPHQAAIAIPVTTSIPPPTKQPPPPQPPATPATTDKLWSSVMGGTDPLHPPPYQSPQFRHEFPSLSAGDGGPTRTGTDALPSYPSGGLSLRPQTEGSWIQGGTRPSTEAASRSSSVPTGPPPQLSAQVGLQHQQAPLPSQFRGVMPSFMCKGSFAPPVNAAGPSSSAPAPPAGNGRNRMESRPPRMTDTEEVAPRPIIKEEELSRMDEIGTDMGWAGHDDIDYNQKLAFSDDEAERPSKRDMKVHRQNKQEQQERAENTPNDAQQKTWGNSRPHAPIRSRPSEEEEVWMQRRSQQDKEVERAVQRAKQRKEEEEKRFNEATKQGAAKKLLELEEKISKRDRENDGNMGTINPQTVPVKPIMHAEIPLPDFQKEKERERDNRSRTPNEAVEEKSAPSQGNRDNNSFRHLTQIEGKNFVRKQHMKTSDRDSREQNGPSFSKHFQNDLPPRFLKHQRQTNTANLHHPVDNTRWMPNSQPVMKMQSNISSGGMRGVRHESPERIVVDEEHNKDFKSPESYRSVSSHQPSPEVVQKSYEEKPVEENFGKHEEDRWQKDKDRYEHKKPDFVSSELNTPLNEEWQEREKFEDKYQSRYERPQRPDSRDSRASRDSRHSRESARDLDPKDYVGPWADAPYEPAYEEKTKEHPREDRRQVPGPITKDRIEADDLRSEKRNLTQLKRGQALEKRKSDPKNDEKLDKVVPEEPDGRSVTEVVPEAGNNENTEKSLTEKSTKQEPLNKIEVDKKPEHDFKDKDNKSSSRNRPYSSHSSQHKGWGGPNDYRSSWSKRPSNRNPPRPSSSQKSSMFNDFPRTSSEGSLDEPPDGFKDGKASGVKKMEKDEKNKEVKQEKQTERRVDRQEKRDNYVPRGEPSRHGRGGGNQRHGHTRLGGLSKRIDGYGPPPSKSPFGHPEDKEKKISSDEVATETPLAEEKSRGEAQAVVSSHFKDKDNAQSYNSDRKGEDKFDKMKPKKQMDNRRGRSKSKNDVGKDEDAGDSNSDNSEDRDGKFGKKMTSKTNPSKSLQNNPPGRRNPPPPRLSNEKRSYGPSPLPSSQLTGNVLAPSKKIEDKSEQNILCNAIADISLKNRENTDSFEDNEESTSMNGDSEGFQEVKSKKNGKDKLKAIDDKHSNINKPLGKPDKDVGKPDRKMKTGPITQLTQQQIQNIPSLMATPVNPPPILPTKNQFERPRQSKLAPRFAKQKLQKAQMQQQQQQQHSMCDMDLNKVNQGLMYGMKDPTNNVVPMSNAWEKPLGSQMRNIAHESMLGVSIESCKAVEHPSPTQANSPNSDKLLGKPNQLQEKTLLDGATPPVNTIIFENTNFKSVPGARGGRGNEKPKKLEETMVDNNVISGFNKPMNELLNKNDKPPEIQIPLLRQALSNEDNVDMKLDFFGTDLSHLTDEKSSKNLCMTKTLQCPTTGNSNICTADSLNIKIASVKKVWETPAEHNVGQDENNTSFSNTFTTDPNTLDPNVFSKADGSDEAQEGYSPSPNHTASTSTNVCKVKPTQQVSGNSGQAVLSSSIQQHSGMVASGLMGNPLSPPPLPQVLGAGVGIGQPPQQYTANQHIGYQTGLGGSTQYGMSAVPSPPTVPTVLYNSTQQLPAQTGLYGAFQIDQAGVLAGQSRSQFSQYPNHYNMGQTASSPYSTPSVYLQTAPPHPPPAAQAPPPELYTNMNSYRLSASAQFGQSQQMNNPTTVLISSTSNSLMSASVKPSSQQISAIGTKANGVGQAYQPQSQQGQQVYMTYDPTLQANYLPNAGVIQRGPGGPVQNSVVPPLQPSSSYYSASTGGQTGYFQQPGNSTLQSAQLQQHQAGYGLQGNVFGTHNQSHTNAGLQSYNSHFLSTQMQVAAALTAQQYRSGLQTQYMKGVGSQGIGEQSGRPQQLKSPSSQEVLNSVFNSGSQISSPKSRQNCKHPPPQSSPTAQHKYNLYQGTQPLSVQRYPPPIQRPVNYQQNLGSTQNTNTTSQKQRSNTNKAPNRQYYTAQSNTISSLSEKTDDSLGNTNSSNTLSNLTNKTSVVGSSSSTVNSSADIIKDSVKDETVLKE